MDTRELENTIQRLDQTVSQLQKDIEDISKTISELEDNGVKLKEQIADALREEALRADSNPNLTFVASEVERKYDRERNEIETNIEDRKKELDDTEKQLREAQRVYDELLKVQSNATRFKIDADNWMREAQRFL